MRRVIVVLAAAQLLGWGAAPAVQAEEPAASEAAWADAFDTYDILAQAQGGKGTFFGLGGSEGEQNRIAGAKVELSKPAQSYAIAAAYQRGVAAGYTYGAVLGQSAAGGAGVAPEPPPGEAVGVYPSGLTEYSFQGPLGTAAGQTVDVKATAKATQIPSAYSDFAFQNFGVPEQAQYQSGHTSARGEPVAKGVETEAVSVLNGIAIGPLRIEHMTSRAYGLVPAEAGDAVGQGSVVVDGATVNGTPVRITSRGIEVGDQAGGGEQKGQLSQQVRAALEAASIKEVRLGESSTEVGDDKTSVTVRSGALKVDYNNAQFGSSNPQGFSGGGLEVGGAYIQLAAARHVERAEAESGPGFTFPFSGTSRPASDPVPAFSAAPAAHRDIVPAVAAPWSQLPSLVLGGLHRPRWSS